jgi:hypothetical protein
MDLPAIHKHEVVRVSTLVGGFTLVLTAAFFGVIAFAQNDVVGIGDRIPVYLLVTAIIFVGALYALDSRELEGLTVLAVVIGFTAVSFVLIVFGAEGILYANANTSEVLSTNLVLYLLAAGLFCTGIGLWGLRHWREFTGDPRTAGELSVDGGSQHSRTDSDATSRSNDDEYLE